MPLYIISTPIGNLKDITLRALDALKDSELILAEDTRRTSILLNHYNIKNKLISFNDYNKEKKTNSIISELKDNKKIGLVSDSGTPGISDPGFYLVRGAVKHGIEIIPIPGPTASIAALISSGFPTDSFIFYGFIPKKEKAKIDFFKEIENNNKTTIIYESPHRLLKTLKTMSEIMPDREICVAREITKKFEEFLRGTTKEIYNKLENRKIKGEITITINKN